MTEAEGRQFDFVDESHIRPDYLEIFPLLPLIPWVQGGAHGAVTAHDGDAKRGSCTEKG